MEWRWEACRVAVADLLAEGRLVYSPVLHNHPILKYKDLGRHWDFWARYDSAMLKKCDKLYVYKLDGWMDSVGLLAETKIAAYSEIPIFSYKNELCNYTVTQIDHPGYYVNSI